VDHRERFSRERGIAEIAEAQGALCHFHLKCLFLLHAVGMPNAFAHGVADGSLFKIDNESAAAAKLPASIGWKPTLGYFNDEICPLLSVRSNPPYGTHGVDFEVAKLARFAAQCIALTSVKAERFRIRIPDSGVIREPLVYR
jgi:hypothetical protein